MTAFTRLPASLGGLGLVIFPTIEAFENLRDIFWWAINAIAQNVEYAYRIRRILSKGFANPSKRGALHYVEEFVKHTESYPSMVGFTFEEARKRYSLPEVKETPEEFLERLRERNIVPLREFLEMLDRPYYFKKLMTFEKVTKFNTSSNRIRYESIWKALEEAKSEFKSSIVVEKSMAVLNKAAKLARFDWLVNLKEEQAMAVGPVYDHKISEDEYFSKIESGEIQFLDAPLDRHILYNVPELRIKYSQGTSLVVKDPYEDQLSAIIGRERKDKT